MALKTVSVLLAVILIAYPTDCQAAQGGCPDNWDQVKEKCYRFFQTEGAKTDFATAEMRCSNINVQCNGQSESGHLARIPCLQLQNELVELANEKGLNMDFYIGLRVDNELRESWTDGGRVTYRHTAWKSAQRVANTRAVMCFSNGGNGQWKAVRPDTSLNYICMLPCVTENIEG